MVGTTPSILQPPFVHRAGFTNLGAVFDTNVGAVALLIFSATFCCLAMSFYQWTCKKLFSEFQWGLLHFEQ